MAGGSGGSFRLHTLSGFRINFSKQFTPMMMTARTQHKACERGGRGATDCVANYQPKGFFQGGGNKGRWGGDLAYIRVLSEVEEKASLGG